MKDTEWMSAAMEIELRRHALAIDDTVTMSDPADDHYGRRIEIDRSWTVYHVFTGTPAFVADTRMIGLSRSEATDKMMSLNQRNADRRVERMFAALMRLNAHEGLTLADPNDSQL
jgi:hypothetical protein